MPQSNLFFTQCTKYKHGPIDKGGSWPPSNTVLPVFIDPPPLQMSLCVGLPPRAAPLRQRNANLRRCLLSSTRGSSALRNMGKGNSKLKSEVVAKLAKETYCEYLLPVFYLSLLCLVSVHFLVLPWVEIVCWVLRLHNCLKVALLRIWSS